MKQLDAIIIPTAPTQEIDLERAQVAVDYYNSSPIKSNFFISGIGSETNKYLKLKDSSLDFHEDLYNFLLNLKKISMS